LLSGVASDALVEPEGFEPSSSRCSLGFCVSNLPNPHGCNRRTHAAAPQSNRASEVCRRSRPAAQPRDHHHRKTCYPAHHRLDVQVPGGEGGGDAVAAVPHDELVAVADELDGRGLTALLEPLTVTLYRRRAEAARTSFAKTNLRE